MLVSILYNVTRERWKQVKQLQPQSKEQEMREVQIRDEKTQRDTQIAVLKAEMENLVGEIGALQNEINRFNEKIKSEQQKIDEALKQQLEARIKAEKIPIETQIATLTAEMESLQSEVDDLNRKVRSTQQKIDQIQVKIEELSELRNKRVINVHQMESRISQFLKGWYTFVAHSSDEKTDVSAQIDSIKRIVDETVNQYYQDPQGYFS